MGKMVLFMVAVLTAAIGGAMVVAGLPSLRDPGPATALLPLGAIAVAVAVEAVRLARAPAIGRLSLVVCPDSLSFVRHGDVADTVDRQEVGVVVVRQAGRAGGVTSVAVWGPQRDLLGRWETGWTMKPWFRVVGALRRHGYPWVIPEAGRAGGEQWRRRHVRRAPVGTLGG